MPSVHDDEPEDSPQRLLRAPAFKREHFKATLFSPYSPKLGRVVHLYTDHRYRLWIREETNRDVKTFNERPPKILLPVSKGRAIQAAPRFVSGLRDGRLAIHTFKGVEDPTQEPEVSEEPLKGSEWSDWCEARSFVHKAWSHDELWSDRLRLDNVEELFRFYGNEGQDVDSRLQEALIAGLRAVRKTTFYELAKGFPAYDREVVHAEIARLVVEQRIFSDIEKHPFSMLTELSVHRHPHER